MRKLMVVDSDRAIQARIEESLRLEGFEVSCFDDGLSALDILSKLDPDLILADYNLEGMNIFRFCDKLRQKSTSKARPLLLMMNPADPVDQNRLRASGVVDFIKKPLKPEDLMEKIRSYSVEPATVIQKMPSPPPPTETPKALDEEQMETLKIEELLGWSLPGEKKVLSTPESKPEMKQAFQEDDRTIIETRMPFPSSPEVSRPREPLQTPPPVAPQAPEAAEPSAASMPETLDQAAIAKTPEAPPTAFPPEAEVITGTEAEQSEAIFSPSTAAPSPPQEESLVQSPASALGGVEPPISPQVLEATVTKMAREIIEKVVWEVVPVLAERLIKEELEKLKSSESH